MQAASISVDRSELVEQTTIKYSSEEIKRIEIQQQKVASGFRDVAGFIKEKIINHHPFKIGVVVGKNAIIDRDIKHQSRESIAFISWNSTKITQVRTQKSFQRF